MNTTLISLPTIAKTAVASLLCVSCSVNVPKSTMYYVDPDTQANVLWPEITEETDRYKLTLAPLGNVDEALVFEVNMLNKSQDSLLIDPRTWNLFAANPEIWNVLDTAQLMNTSEIAVLYDQLADKVKTAQDNETAAVVLVGVVLIVGVLFIIANAESDSDDSESDSDGQWVDSSVDFFTEVSFSGGARPTMTTGQIIQELKRESARFQRSFLESTYLLPEEEITFDLYYHRDQNKKGYILETDFEGKHLSWKMLHEIDGMKSEQYIGIPSRYDY